MRQGKLKISATVMTSTVIILIGASLIKFKSALLSSLLFIIGILVLLVGFIEFVNFFAKRDKHKSLYQLIISILLIAAGVLISIFNEPLQHFAFLVISIMLFLQAIYDIVKFARIKWRRDLFFGILKGALATVILVATFFQMQDTLLMVVGHLMLVFGALFIIIDTF
ncbi:MAG TPA: DUF308 domain-containing protein [Bacilli bacterium]|nr:DUF308 domain-containing protein [Bacilli bacterium]